MIFNWEEMDIIDNKSALILLDLQNEMVDLEGKIGSKGLAKVIAERRVIENATYALEAARAAGISIAHVRLGFRQDYADSLSIAPRIAALKQARAAIVGEFGTEFPAPLTPMEGELVVTKQCVNPFFNTGLMNWLFQRSVKNIIIGGVVTNLVVESTARAADDAGFGVVVLQDLCAAPNSEWHDFSIKNMIPMFARVQNAREVFD